MDLIASSECSYSNAPVTTHGKRLKWSNILPVLAGLSHNLSQSGKPARNQEQIGGRIGYAFRGKDYIIAASFLTREFHALRTSAAAVLCLVGERRGLSKRERG
jgi:hypothetical protein